MINRPYINSSSDDGISTTQGEPVTITLPPGSPPEDITKSTCFHCKKRKAVGRWTGTASVLDQVHGHTGSPVCQICALKFQLEYCSFQAARIPGIEMELEELKRAEQQARKEAEEKELPEMD